MRTRLRSAADSAAPAPFSAEDRDYVVSFLRKRASGRFVDDLAQKVLLTAWRYRPRYNATLGNFRAWLTGITKAHLRDHRRFTAPKARREVALPAAAIPDEAPDPEQAAILASRRKYLESEIATLPQRQRAVLEAHDLEGQTFSEIAGSLGMTEQDVRAEHDRAMAALRERARRWRAAQQRRRLPLTPMVLAPFAATRRAWASRPPGALLRALAAALACAFAIWCVSSDDQGAPRWAAHHLPPLPPPPPDATPHTTAPASAAPAPADTPPGASAVSPARDPARGPAPPGSPTRPSAERKLMQQVAVARSAGNHATARRLLEEHKRRFAHGEYAAKRDVMLLELAGNDSGRARR